MNLQPESMEWPLAASLRATYRALLARGLEAGEAANLTAFMHGLPSAGLNWTLPEIEAIINRRISHAAVQRAVHAASAAAPARTVPTATATSDGAVPRRRLTSTIRRRSRSAGTRVVDPPPT